MYNLKLISQKYSKDLPNRKLWFLKKENEKHSIKFSHAQYKIRENFKELGSEICSKIQWNKNHNGNLLLLMETSRQLLMYFYTSTFK